MSQINREKELQVLCQTLDRNGYLVTKGLKAALEEGLILVRKQRKEMSDKHKKEGLERRARKGIIRLANKMAKYSDNSSDFDSEELASTVMDAIENRISG